VTTEDGLGEGETEKPSKDVAVWVGVIRAMIYKANHCGCYGWRRDDP